MEGRGANFWITNFELCVAVTSGCTDIKFIEWIFMVWKLNLCLLVFQG